MEGFGAKICGMHLSAIVSILAMWLVVRSNWLHDLFCGIGYNWLVGSAGTAAVVGMAIGILL